MPIPVRRDRRSDAALRRYKPISALRRFRSFSPRLDAVRKAAGLSNICVPLEVQELVLKRTSQSTNTLGIWATCGTLWAFLASRRHYASSRYALTSAERILATGAAQQPRVLPGQEKWA